MLHQAQGLPASPLVLYKLMVGGERRLPFFIFFIFGGHPESSYELALKLRGFIDGHGRSFRGQTRECSDKVSRSRNLEMVRQRRLVGPLLNKNETIGILSIDVHRVRDATGLGSRASNVLLAQNESLLNSAALRGDTSDYENHSPKLTSDASAESPRTSYTTAVVFALHLSARRYIACHR